MLQLDEAPDHLSADVSIHLLRIVGEAMTNARRHAGARRVELRVETRGEALSASVADDGCGVARGAALGRGMAGMHERAELLGGSLTVSERPGGGTIVELRARLFEHQQAAEPARVLFVDDHAATREAMAMAFADDGRFVVAAQAGSVADARQALKGIDVAIIDLVLPDGDGSDLIPELRAVKPERPGAGAQRERGPLGRGSRGREGRSRSAERGHAPA